MNHSKLKTVALILGLLFISSFAHMHDYKCKHDELGHPEHVFGDIDEENFPVPQDENGRFLAQTTYNNLRTYGHYDTIPAGSFKTYMQTRLGPALLDYFSGALKVKYPVSGKLTIPSGTKTLCSVTVPSILRTGVNADYFIMFTSEYDKPASAQATTWVAESYSCYLATGSKRPLVAKTHLNSAVFVDPKSDILLHEKNVYMMLHELTHTLGFASSLYNYYLDANGKKLTGHVTTEASNGATAKVVNVPVLTNRLKSFFGCSTLKGAYMENTGSSATAGSHFERRMFGFEAMTSGLIYQQAYSQFSLGMLEATGWYVPDYTYADPYWMGQGQGCGFLTDKCSTANTKYDDFCSTSSRGCTVTGRGGGTCSDDTRSDGCKFVHPKVNYDCDNEGASSGARLPSLQAFGRTAYSKCFEGTLSSSSTTSKTSFCFKYSCSGSGTTTKLAVTVGTKTLTCTEAGSMSVSGYKGYITCPDPLTFCSTVGAKVCPRGCMGRGTCVDGKCVCKTGYSGKDCAA